MIQLSLLIVAGLAVVALVGLFVLARKSREPAEVGLVGGRLRDCPETPNCACSEGASANVAPLALGGDAEASFRALVERLAREPRYELVRADDGYAHFAVRTPLIGFVDDVELRLDRAAGVAHVRSASRVGRSDLGANRRRVEALRTETGQFPPDQRGSR